MLLLLNPTSGFTNDTLFKQVQTKLLKDKQSFDFFCILYNEFVKFKIINDSLLENHYDLSIRLYNKGIPFARLINKDSLDLYFKKIYQKKGMLKHACFKRYYKCLVRNYKYYNNDDYLASTGAQEEYFRTYLKDYYILPSTE